MYAGQIAGVLDAAEATTEQIGELMAGGKLANIKPGSSLKEAS
ncbi:hypothetical protein [Ewingella americana]